VVAADAPRHLEKQQVALVEGAGLPGAVLVLDGPGRAHQGDEAGVGAAPAEHGVVGGGDDVVLGHARPGVGDGGEHHRLRHPRSLARALLLEGGLDQPAVVHEPRAVHPLGPRQAGDHLLGDGERQEGAAFLDPQAPARRAGLAEGLERRFDRRLDAGGRRPADRDAQAALPGAQARHLAFGVPGREHQVLLEVRGLGQGANTVRVAHVPERRHLVVDDGAFHGAGDQHRNVLQGEHEGLVGEIALVVEAGQVVDVFGGRDQAGVEPPLGHLGAHALEAPGELLRGKETGRDAGVGWGHGDSRRRVTRSAKKPCLRSSEAPGAPDGHGGAGLPGATIATSWSRSKIGCAMR
jgi:hypothetical protein